MWLFIRNVRKTLDVEAGMSLYMYVRPFAVERSKGVEKERSGQRAGNLHFNSSLDPANVRAGPEFTLPG